MFVINLCGKWIDSAEEGGLSDGGHHPDEEGEDEEGERVVHPLQEPEDDVGRACHERPIDEELARPDRLDVLAKDGGRQYGSDEHRPVNL